MQLNRAYDATLSLIPSGPDGILETLRVMKRLAREGKKNLTVRNTAMSLTQGCGQKDYACEVRTLHAFVRDQIRYIGDIAGVETVQAPEVTLQLRAGDCDDKATLIMAMLESIGHPCRFRAIGFSPDVYEHVYVETKIGAQWVPLETTEPVNVGWQPNPRAIMASMYY